MSFWYRKKTRLEILKSKYSDLMRKSFETALRDREKSQLVKRKAKEIYEEIEYLSLSSADK
ncbi:MAG: Lacal_2735 family protein [Patiriisocius sp.]|uniref:Lacal_2735 family protein n=1 Tax=Patiriisocius sp. TaxID=2822396 RepID=UPI003EF33830